MVSFKLYQSLFKIFSDPVLFCNDLRHGSLVHFPMQNVALQEWYNMGEHDLRLELMLHDLEPAIGFWYPERRMVCPEAKAGIVAPAGQPSKPISFSQLFTISPDVVSPEIYQQ